MSGFSKGLRMGDWVFAPRVLPTLAYLVLLPLLISLGVWQLDRAEQKHQALAERAAASRAPVVDLNETPTRLASHEYRRARGSGRFDASRQFLLDNRIQDGQVGYRVLTPLRLAGQDRAVLVDRGFVPIVGNRQVLPDLPPVPPEAEVAGRIRRGPSVGIRLGEPADNAGEWPRRVQYLDFDYMAEELGYPIADYLLVEGSLSNDPVVRRSGRDAWRFGPERHEGYAVQWFSLAAALTVIWLVVNTKRKHKRTTGE